MGGHGRTWADMADMRAGEGYFFKHCQVCVCFRETKETDGLYFVAIHSLLYNSNGTLLSSFPSTPVVKSVR
jgi:hypothetical protein